MRITSFITTSVLFCTLAIMPVHAQIVNQGLKDRAVIEYNYKMYIEGNGGVNNDALHAEFTLKRKEYLSAQGQQNQQTTAETTAVLATTPTPAAQKDDDLDKLIKFLNLVKGVKNIFQ
jgi:hypothetical protein